MSMFKDTSGEMINLFRSEEMEYMQFVLPRDSAYHSTHELGTLGMVHFIDLNPHIHPSRREFYPEIRRCDELQRILRFFRVQLVWNDITPLEHTEHSRYNLSDLETKFTDAEVSLQQLQSNNSQLLQNKNELIEMRNVLELAAPYFSGSKVSELRQAYSEQAQLRDTDVRLGFVSGVIQLSKYEQFSRMIYVATRGNVFLDTIPIAEPVYDPTLGKSVEKTVFVAFFSGERALTKITRISESYNAAIYPFSENEEERAEVLNQIRERLVVLQEVEDKATSQKLMILKDIAENLESWTDFICRERALFHTLNMFSSDTTSKCLVGEGWVPTRSVNAVNDCLQRASISSSSSVPSIAQSLNWEGKKRRGDKLVPPTYIRRNKFTSAVQSLVNSYGIASYGEVNPGLLSLVTFPFLFAVMYGDIGHGMILLLTGLFFIMIEKKVGKGMNDLISYLYVGRYLLLVMGAMAIYTGLLYNETFSFSLNFFGSGYKCVVDEITGESTCVHKHTYIIGMDPIWRSCFNNLIMTNSLKMKMSIIIGVLHMLIGIAFSCVNHIHFKHWIDVWCEFIPQMLLMLSLFGYMCFLIIYKWMSPQEVKPMIIRTMINMFLSFSSPIPPDEQLIPHQAGIQRFLLLVIVITIPWMLIPKPCIEIYQHRKEMKKIQAKQEQYKALQDGEEGYQGTSMMVEEEDAQGMAEWTVADEEFNLGEVLINTLIECIEFVLGAISNTASYLRLWALSLAHGQLGEVFLEYCMVKASQLAGPIGIALGVTVWIGATIAILCAMEGLSAFLHCLRLHWVELQNKFYKAEGYPFEPLSFATAFEEEDLAGFDQMQNEIGKREAVREQA
ncbi:putative V-type proton ATPase subunit a3 [Blattamonas nauphoetae]|uniref:V-type proton ATPase subunit a n=1 Tax=Blattamonas nauphoetae TaxID=2049346 RepID=A0ABQ9Y1V8_9EUKA|nr:putative V-type proton ATPase subunit a3 [Blattamonas nauphoetae]